MTGSLLTIVEAAESTGRSRDFIRRLVASGAVKGRKDHGRWYVNRRSLDAWVDCGEPDPPHPDPLYVIPAVSPSEWRSSHAA